jgi:RHS repeat-associated protein
MATANMQKLASHHEIAVWLEALATSAGVSVNPSESGGLLSDGEGRVASLTLSPIDDDLPAVNQVTTPSGRIIQNCTSAKGLIVSLENSGCTPLCFEHDDGERLAEVTMTRSASSESSYRFDYDERGRLVQISFPDGSTRAFQYDGSGRLSQVLQDGVLVVDMAASGHGQHLASLVDASGACTRVTVTEGELRLAYPDGNFVSYTRATPRAIDVWRPEGPFLRVERGAQHTRVTYADLSTNNYIYDAQGRLTTLRGDGHVLELDYSERGALEKEQIDDAQTLVSFNRAGEVIDRTFSSPLEANGAPRTVSYGRDEDGRVSAVIDARGALFDLQYGESGALEQIGFANGTTTHVGVDGYGLERWIQTSSSVGTLLCERVFDYDARDRLASMRDGTRQWTYAYDTFGRLSEVEERQVVETERGVDTQLVARSSLQPDPLGNFCRLADVEAHYNIRGQLTRWGDQELSYDSRGNLIERRDSRGVTRYVFNARDQLVELWSGGNFEKLQWLASYEYDGLGRRLRKSTQHEETRFFWVGTQLRGELEVRNDGTRIHRDFLFVVGWDWPLAMREFRDGDSTGELTCIHCDQRGAPVAATDEQGGVVWRASYDVLGAAETEGAAEAEDEELFLPFRLPGQYFDRESGLHYSLCRYYDPSVGRYISADPLGLSGGSFNPYLYGDGDPINRAVAPERRLTRSLSCGAAVASQLEQLARHGSMARAAASCSVSADPRASELQKLSLASSGDGNGVGRVAELAALAPLADALDRLREAIEPLGDPNERIQAAVWGAALVEVARRTMESDRGPQGADTELENRLEQSAGSGRVEQLLEQQLEGLSTSGGVQSEDSLILPLEDILADAMNEQNVEPEDEETLLQGDGQAHEAHESHESLDDLAEEVDLGESSVDVYQRLWGRR